LFVKRSGWFFLASVVVGAVRRMPDQRPEVDGGVHILEESGFHIAGNG